MRSFYIEEEPYVEGKYYIAVKIVIYREKHGRYPDFLSWCETPDNKRDGYNTKFAFVTEEMLDYEDAKIRCEELEKAYAEKLRECENTGDWTDCPIDFHKLELLWNK